MADLIVRIKNGNHAQQSFRLAASTLPAVVGSSPKAAIQLGGLRGIEGAFEFRDGSWWYISMQADSFEVETQLSETARQLEIGKYSLEVFHGKSLRRPVLTNLPQVNKKDIVILSQRPKTTLTSSDKRIITAAVVVPVLAMVMSLFSPSPQEELLAKEVYKPKPVMAQTRMEIKKPVPQKVKEVKKQAVFAPKIVEGKAQKAAKSASTKVEKNNPILKIRKGSLSNLIGKVSARSAKSKEIVIAKGKTAGNGPSGRAFAVAGAVSRQTGKSGLNDIGEADGVRVSTIGKGGGSSAYQGIGTMKDGEVGKGNLDVIEEETEIAGGLEREIIASYIKSQLGQILYCYERQLSAEPNLFGKVAVSFTIGSMGQVETQRIGTTSLKSATVEGCILRKVAQWKFPQPEGGTQVNVTYPFLFKSTN